MNRLDGRSTDEWWGRIAWPIDLIAAVDVFEVCLVRNRGEPTAGVAGGLPLSVRVDQLDFTVVVVVRFGVPGLQA